MSYCKTYFYTFVLTMLDINKIYLTDVFSMIDMIPDNSIDLVISDGPYGITDHEWDKVNSIQEFNLQIIKIFSNKLKKGGALYLFGKPDCIDFIDYRPYLHLQAKIVWYQPSRLAQGKTNYTNNYDLICYFTKGDKPKTFNLNDIRVPQLVDLNHRMRCENVPSVRNGKYQKTKYNDKGKNPGDVWGDIKQLTYKSKELLSRDTLHTIQKPEKLMKRIILANSNAGEIVLDPFCGTGTVPAVARRLGRFFIAFEKNPDMYNIAIHRLQRVEEEMKSQLF